MKISCKSCGANLVFIPSKQVACCEHCGNIYKPEDIEYDEIIFDEYEEYTCSSCGAKLISFGKTGITSCIYCHGKEFVVGKVSKDYILTGIIPFRLDKEQFIKNYEEAIAELTGVENGFKESLKNAKIEGAYLPYSFANSFYRKQYGEVLFTLLEEVVPYNFEDVKGLNPIYLDGLMADTIKVKKEENDIKTKDGSFYWVPVWIAEIEYKDEIYYIVANGQTWEMAGMYKVDLEKNDYIFIPETQRIFQEKLFNIEKRKRIREKTREKKEKNEVLHEEIATKKQKLILENEALEKELDELKRINIKEENNKSKRTKKIIITIVKYILIYLLILFTIFMMSCCIMDKYLYHASFISYNVTFLFKLSFGSYVAFLFIICINHMMSPKIGKEEEHYGEILHIKNKIEANKEYMNTKIESDSLSEILKYPEEKIYKDIHSICLFTKKYSLKDKSNIESQN